MDMSTVFFSNWFEGFAYVTDYLGCVSVSFRALGTYPESTDDWKMSNITGIRWEACLFRNHGEMPSGPCDLHMLDMLGLIKFWLILGLILGLLFYLLHLASLVTHVYW